jgi:hypothetical protein
MRDSKPLPAQGANIDLIKARSWTQWIDQDADEILVEKPDVRNEPVSLTVRGRIKVAPQLHPCHSFGIGRVRFQRSLRQPIFKQVNFQALTTGDALDHFGVDNGALRIGMAMVSDNQLAARPEEHGHVEDFHDAMFAASA